MRWIVWCVALLTIQFIHICLKRAFIWLLRKLWTCQWAWRWQQTMPKTSTWARWCFWLCQWTTQKERQQNQQDRWSVSGVVVFILQMSVNSKTLFAMRAIKKAEARQVIARGSELNLRGQGWIHKIKFNWHELKNAYTIENIRTRMFSKMSLEHWMA